MRRLKKLSYDGKQVVIRWEVPKLNGVDEHELKCNDAPAPHMRQALDGLRAHVLGICELPDSYQSGLEVRGASFSYGGEDEVMGATITALKHVTTANAPLVLNTPHLPSAPYSDSAEGVLLLPEKAIEVLDVLSAEAFRYVDGQRAQGELFEKAEAESEPQEQQQVMAGVE